MKWKRVDEAWLNGTQDWYTEGKRTGGSDGRIGGRASIAVQRSLLY